MSDIPALVRQLRSTRRTEQLRAAEQLDSSLRHSADDRAQLVAAGGLAPLVQLLSSGSQALQARASEALLYVSQDEQLHACLREAVTRGGGIPALVGILTSRSADRQLERVVHYSAAATLEFLTDRPDCLSAMLAAGVVPAILPIAACESGDDSTAVAAQDLMLTLALQPASCRAVAAAAPVPALMRALQLHVEHSSGRASRRPNTLAKLLSLTDDRVARGVVFLLNNRPGLVAAALAAGAPAALCELLGCCSQEARPLILGALAMLASSGVPGAAQSVVAAGGLAAIVQQLACQSSSGSARQLNPLLTAVLRCARTCPEVCSCATTASFLRVLQRLASEGPDEAPPGQFLTTRQLAAEVERALAAARPSNRSSSSSGTPRAPRVCAAPGCGATSGLRRCGGCATVRYCSEACCRAHWREHRAECRRLAPAERRAGGEGSEAAAAPGAA